MPEYKYRAVAAGGDLLEGVIDAPTKSRAIEKLQQAGHMPISADEVKDKPGFLFGNKLRIRKHGNVSKEEMVFKKYSECEGFIEEQKQICDDLDHN